MGNTSDEIKIIEAEIEKTEKAIWKELEDYKELEREASDHFKRNNYIPPKAEIFKEARKILVDTMLNASKGMTAHRDTIKKLQSRLDTLKQSRENKLNKIVFKEDLERAELSAKYAKQNPQDTPAMFNWSTDNNKQEVCLNGKTVTKLPNIPYKLFSCLLKKKGKFVKTETLEKCWDRKPKYDTFLVDKMNKLKAALKKELTEKEINIQGEIIESQKNDKRKVIAYKLPH